MAIKFERSSPKRTRLKNEAVPVSPTISKEQRDANLRDRQTLSERSEPVHIEKVGAALYGKFWVSGLASDLGVSVQTIRNWSSAGHVPENREQPLRQLVRDRIGSLEALLEGVMFSG